MVLPNYLIQLLKVTIYSALVKKLEWGPMPNVMASQPNVGGALCESSRNFIPCTTSQSLANYGSSSAVQ